MQTEFVQSIGIMRYQKFVLTIPNWYHNVISQGSGDYHENNITRYHKIIRRKPRSMVFQGSPRYMAPEQLDANEHKPSLSWEILIVADIWIVLYISLEKTTIYIRHIWGWLLSKIPSKDYHHVSLWILGVAHWLQEQMSWILHPLEITVCNPKMCKAHQGPSKGEDCFPSAPFLLGTMAVSFRECIDPCEPPDCPPQLAISTTDPKACQTGCRIHPSFAVAFQIPKHYIIQNQSDWHGGEITIE